MTYHDTFISHETLVDSPIEDWKFTFSLVYFIFLFHFQLQDWQIYGEYHREKIQFNKSHWQH